MIKTTPAPVVAKKSLIWIAYAYGGLLVVAVAAQLLTFSDFIEQIHSYGIMAEVAPWVASGLVLSQVFALPFVLRLDLSPLARQASAVLSMLVPLAWLGLVLCAMAGYKGFVQAAYFGGFVEEWADWVWIFGNILVFCWSVWAFMILGGPSAFKNRLSKPKK